MFRIKIYKRESSGHLYDVAEAETEDSLRDWFRFRYNYRQYYFEIETIENEGENGLFRV